jgi:uncharacterized Zn-binding protein involved in type VI secretion
MALNNARQTDLHSHGGYIVSGSPDVYTNGLRDARQTDMCMCPIHGMVQIINGSATVYDNGLRRARSGDMLSCGAIIISGSPDTYTGD